MLGLPVVWIRLILTTLDLMGSHHQNEARLGWLLPIRYFSHYNRQQSTSLIRMIRLKDHKNDMGDIWLQITSKQQISFNDKKREKNLFNLGRNAFYGSKYRSTLDKTVVLNQQNRCTCSNEVRISLNSTGERKEVSRKRNGKAVKKIKN